MRRTIHLLHDSPERRIMVVVDESDPASESMPVIPGPPRLPAEMRPTVRPGLAKVIDMPRSGKRVA